MCVVHVQVLEEQERRIQHEMQLLRMAMQREQEGDSNGNHVSDASTTSEQANNSNSSGINRHHLPPNIGPSYDILLQCSGLEPHQTMQPRPSVFDGVQMAPTDQPIQSNRPGQLFPATSSSPSVGTCNNAFCNDASSAVDSDSSSSPDINSNILAAGFGKTESKCPGGAVPGDAVAVILGTGDAPSSDVPRDNMAARERSLSLPSAGVKAGRDDGDSCQVGITEDSVQTGRQGGDFGTLPGLATPMADNQPASGDDSERSVEEGSPLARLNTDKFSEPSAYTEDLELCDVEPEAGQPKYGLSLPVDYGKWSDEEGPDLSTRRPKRKVFQADLSLRQSVDMEVEDSDDEDDIVSSSATAHFSPFVPQAPRQAGPAGRDQPLSYAYNEVTAKVNPVSVIIRPSIVVPSTPCDEKMAANCLVSPPIWTTLALQSAADNNRGLALSGLEGRPSGTSSPHARQSPCVSPASGEIEAIAAAVSRSISLSPKLIRRGSPSKRALRLGTRRRSISPTWSPSSCTDKRSPLHATLRQGQGPIPGVALRNPDVFLEALLEDECALYAGRLQSFFKNMETSCDREELPDPVARILDEGDDMVSAQVLSLSPPPSLSVSLSLSKFPLFFLC